MYKKALILLVTGISLTSLPAIAQQSRMRTDERATLMSTPSVRDAMTRLEQRADRFEDRFEDALNRSGYNGSHTEDTLVRWADRFEDEVDDMAKAYKSNDTTAFISHFENAMIVSSAINRSMLRKDFSANAESHWAGLRADMNHIAGHLHRPVLPNITAIVISPAPVTLLSRTDVRQVLSELEASTDRFEDKLRKTLQHSTANMTSRERVWNQWADYLEDTSDDMLEEFREKDPTGFQEELERTLMVADALNRMMLRSDLSAAAEAEWRTVRNQLNIVASAFNYPVIGDLIQAR
jgi:hypothetical protein